MPDALEQMMSEFKMRKVEKLFNELSQEIYYGFNMRLILRGLIDTHPEIFDTLKALVEQCQEARKR